MKICKIILAGLLALFLGASSLVAGTPGITGVHSGTYDFKAYRSGVNYGKTYSSYNWTIDFDNETVTVQDGQANTLLGVVDYEISGAKTISDNNDGTYTFSYKFQPQGPFSSPIFTFETVLEITQTTNGLTIVSVDSDNNGTPGAESISTTGTFPVELNWYGSTN